MTNYPNALDALSRLREELSTIKFPSVDGGVYTALDLYGRGLDAAESTIRSHEAWMVDHGPSRREGLEDEEDLHPDDLTEYEQSLLDRALDKIQDAL